VGDLEACAARMRELIASGAANWGTIADVMQRNAADAQAYKRAMRAFADKAGPGAGHKPVDGFLDHIMRRPQRTSNQQGGVQP
jgi:hypothetical protein